MPTVIITILVALAVVVAVYLLCLYPGKRRSITPFNTIRYAHRGLHDDNLPENSLAAFVAAKEASYGVEFDIQLTSDKQIVVFHDADLKRMCGVDKKVSELTYAELDQYTLLDSDQHIPLLIEVLDVLDGTPVLCEFKSHGSITDHELCELAYPLLSAYKGPLCIESFNPLMMRWFRQNHPEFVRGILSMNYDATSGLPFYQRVLLTSLMTNCLTHPDFIALKHTDSHLLSFRLSRRVFGCAAFAWTVRSEADEAVALRTFDTVIFENYRSEKNKKS